MTKEQKTVVRLGVNGRLVSAKEIWEQVGIVSEDYYRQLIESLRDLKILETKVSKTEVTKQSRKYDNSRKAVPRYEIKAPKESRRL